MTLIEELTLAGYFQIKGTPLKAEECFMGGDSRNILDIEFSDKKECLIRLEEYNLNFDETLSLIENLEKLKEEDSIVDYDVKPLIKESDKVSIKRENIGGSGEIENLRGEYINVNSEVLDLLKKQNKIVKNYVMYYNIRKE